jgi:hypothetical protein
MTLSFTRFKLAVNAKVCPGERLNTEQLHFS